MDIKLTEKEILDYAIAEEGLLFASADDYLSIAEIVIEQINTKLKSAQPTQPQTVKDALEQAAKICDDLADKFNVEYQKLKDSYTEGAIGALDSGSQAIRALIQTEKE